MTPFFSNVPIWVFPLFIVLLVLGLRASKDRSVSIALIYLLPLLGILTFRNILALSPPIWVWAVAALTYACGITLGMALQNRWSVERGARLVKLRGEWATLTAMMIIFAAGFVNGALSTTMPALTQTGVFTAGFAAINCLASGQFLGRAIATLRAPITQSS
ncbi:hypothetical protein [Planktotalea sp.]|uniref:hypothetical protein n=1 Tax=Planktotalea sp. TaxID=2029877 RepID=UPI0025E4FBD6|nr:hypothetical protein [Planktotalea sp.]